MITLFLDTSNTKSLVSLYKDTTLIAEKYIESKNNLSSFILPAINKILNDNKINVDMINKLLVVNGPGSFTGIRIGVTIAKTLAWAKKISINTLSSLELLATTEVDCEYVVSLIDARRDYFYAGMYDKTGKSIIYDQYISKDQLITEIEKITDLSNVTFVSYDEIEEFDIKQPCYNLSNIIDKYKDKQSLEPHNVNPNYLKKVEAEEKLNDSRN